MEQALTYRGVTRKALDWARESRYTSTQIVVGAFLALILVGALLLMLPFATTGPGIRFVDALFTMTSAVCVTGLIVLDTPKDFTRSEEHTSELQSPCNLVCRLLLEKKKKNNK